MPFDMPLAGLMTRYGISRPESREGIVPLMPSGRTTGLGSGVLPSHRSFRYSAAPIYSWSGSFARGNETPGSTHLIPSRPLFPDVDKLLIELFRLLVG